MGAVDDVREALDILEREGVPHMLVGGFAQEALGVPRSTLDVDLQVSLPSPPPASASTWLGFVVEERTRDAVFGQDVLIAHLPLSTTPFEFFLTGHWLTAQALERRAKARSELLGREVPVPTVEDFVLLKAAHMVAPSRSRRKAAQDALDIEQVLDAALAPVDIVYVRENATRLGLWHVIGPLLS